MLKSFLQPRWVLFTLFVVLFSYFAFTLLAPWQLNKDHRIVERNHQIEAAYAADPVPLADALSADGSLLPNGEWTRVTMTGHYLADDEVLLRLRPVGSGPTYQSLVPFKTDSGLTILINRGWVAAGEANSVPDFAPAPSNEVTLTAMLRAGEGPHPNSAPIEDQGFKQIYTINPEQVGELTGLKLAHDYAQLITDDAPGVLGPIPVPQLDRGSHLSYGFQWIAFGIMAPIGLGYFMWAEVRERRRARAEEAELAAADAALVPSAPPVPGPADDADNADNATETVTEAAAPAPAASASGRRKRARYGDAKPDFYTKKERRERS